MFSVPSVLFMLIWLFSQYKYDLAWDYGRMKWTFYFNISLSYTSVFVLCLLMVLLPVGVYQYRVNTFYNNSTSVDIIDFDKYSRHLAHIFLTNNSDNEDLSRLAVGSDEYQKGKEEYVNTFLNNLNNITPSYNFDTIIKPSIETIFKPDPVLILSQDGDSMKKYRFHHIWIVKLDKKSKSDVDYLEGTLNMFSPRIYFARNKDLIYKKFDSSSYIFQSFFDEDYLTSDQLPRTEDENEFIWSKVLFDSSYYIESQKVKCFDKKVISKITDHRLNKTYFKYVFRTDLPDQGIQFEEYFIGLKLRGQNLLLDPYVFCELKRLEHFLFERFNIKSLEHITPEFVNEQAVELQELGNLINQIESDYGKGFMYYDLEKLFILLIVTYVVTAVLTLILLTVRLLNFRLLILSLLTLSILSFIVFVPLKGFRVYIFNSIPCVGLSILYGYFIFSILRILYATGTTLFMRVSALCGLIVLPFIAFFYFNFYFNNYKYEFYSEKKEAMILTGFIITVVFLIGHIPLMARTIHKMFYLPKR